MRCRLYHILFLVRANSGDLSVIFYPDQQSPAVRIGKGGERFCDLTGIGNFKLKILPLVFAFSYEQMYCQPEVNYTMQTFQAEGRSVLVVQIEESLQKPVYAKDETGKPLAYLRIKDENILATPVHLRVWQQSGSPRGELITYTEREQLLLDLLEENDSLSLNRYCRLAHLSRRAAEHLLAKFIRFDIVEPVFEGHKFHFRLK